MRTENEPSRGLPSSVVDRHRQVRGSSRRRCSRRRAARSRGLRRAAARSGTSPSTTCDREVAGRLVRRPGWLVAAAAGRRRPSAAASERRARDRERASEPVGGRRLWRLSPKARGTYHARRPGRSGSASGEPRSGSAGARRLWVAAGRPIEYIFAVPAAGRGRGRRRSRWSDPSPTGRSCPPSRLFEQVGDMMILTGKTIVVRGQAALPLRRRVHRPVPLRPAALLVPDADLAPSPSASARPGLQAANFLIPVRRARPPRRLLRPRLDPRVRARS